MLELISEKDGRITTGYAEIEPLQKEAPGFLTGVASSPFVGVKHAWDVGASVLAEAVSPTIEKYVPEKFESWLIEQRQKTLQSMRDTRANPETMGTMAQLGHALGSVLTMGAAGGAVGGIPGAVAAIGTGTGYDKYKEMREQGVDKNTALQAAGITGSVMGVGAALPPFIGNTIAKQIATGVGLNVGLGMVERGGTSKVLEDAGYADMAKHYNTIDGTAMLIDAVLGAAFPVGARALRKVDVPTAEIDAAMDSNKYVHERNREAAIPGSMESAAKIADAHDYVAQQIIEGKSLAELDIPRGLYDDSVPNPKIADEVVASARALDDVHKAEGYGSLADTEAKMSALESAYRAVDEKPVEATPMILEEGKEIDVHTRSKANDVIKGQEDMVVTGDDGRDVSAKEYLQKAEAEYQQEVKATKIYDVAVACAMRVGE